MQIIKGNLWDELGHADVILFTANNTLNAKGELVMGAGAAREAKERFPDLPRFLGYQIASKTGDYGVVSTMVPYQGGRQRIAAFQTKRHWKSPSPLDLLKLSCEKLAGYAKQFPVQRIALNYPGIGLGGLTESDVLPLLETLPDNVFVYRL
jgi:hypothetical protein